MASAVGTSHIHCCCCCQCTPRRTGQRAGGAHLGVAGGAAGVHQRAEVLALGRNCKGQQDKKPTLEGWHEIMQRFPTFGQTVKNTRSKQSIGSLRQQQQQQRWQKIFCSRAASAMAAATEALGPPSGPDTQPRAAGPPAQPCQTITCGGGFGAAQLQELIKGVHHRTLCLGHLQRRTSGLESRAHLCSAGVPALLRASHTPTQTQPASQPASHPPTSAAAVSPAPQYTTVFTKLLTTGRALARVANFSVCSRIGYRVRLT